MSIQHEARELCVHEREREKKSEAGNESYQGSCVCVRQREKREGKQEAENYEGSWGKASSGAAAATEEEADESQLLMGWI